MSGPIPVRRILSHHSLTHVLQVVVKILRGTPDQKELIEKVCWVQSNITLIDDNCTINSGSFARLHVGVACSIQMSPSY